MRRTTKVTAICASALLAMSCSTEQAPADQTTTVNGTPTVIEARPVTDFRPTTTLEPNGGSELGPVFEAWLSPHQEGGEERDTPAIIPEQFRSTTPSVDRADRPSRGHGTLTFARDFSKAYVHLMIEGVKVEEINMLHIHCGRPGQLGPILVDLGMARDLVQEFADGELIAEIANEDIVAVVENGESLTGAFTAGCPIVPVIPGDEVVTVAGMASIAFERELYFNLHTTSQTYFGDIRGQLHPVTQRPELLAAE